MHSYLPMCERPVLLPSGSQSCLSTIAVTLWPYANEKLSTRFRVSILRQVSSINRRVRCFEKSKIPVNQNRSKTRGPVVKKKVFLSKVTEYSNTEVAQDTGEDWAFSSRLLYDIRERHVGFRTYKHSPASYAVLFIARCLLY